MLKPHSFSVLLTAILLLAACNDDSTSGGGGAGGSGGQPISDATELVCPSPGLLPFHTEARDFATDANRQRANANPRSKDEASDTLGIDGGLQADTYMASADPSAATELDYLGRKARTTQNGGLSAYPLAGEPVSLWYYDPDTLSWITLGRQTTDDNGYYSLLPAMSTPTKEGRPVYSILEADGSCAEHYNYLLPETTPVIITDIDGTLTLNDEELFAQIDDGSYTPKQITAANTLMTRWAEKGYRIVYITARPHLFRAETRAWLRDEGFPTGPVITGSGLVFGSAAHEYKLAWMNRMLVDFKWNVVAAYGNADSDISAYAAAGIPKEVTFIVGPLAGTDGTQPIDNFDYTSHIATYVDAQPDI